MSMRWALAVALLLVVPLASGHVFNHEDRDIVCQLYGDPHSHFIGDGHKHTHDPANKAFGTDGHDPCNQSRMAYSTYQNDLPLSEITKVTPAMREIDPAKVLFSDGDPTHTNAFVGGEYYQFGIPEAKFRKLSSLTVTSDLAAAGMGFPGDGSPEHPYDVSGYLIVGGNMVFKDTSKCFAIHDNVIVSRAAKAPLLPDPGKILNLTSLIPYWQQVNKTASDLRSLYTNLTRDWDLQKAAWDANKTAQDAAKAVSDAVLADFQARQAAWDAAFAKYARDYLYAVNQTEALADDFEWYAGQYQSVSQPARPHEAYIDRVHGTIADMDALQPSFESYQQDQERGLLSDVEGWIQGTPPPAAPPPGWWGDASQWEAEKQNYANYQGDIEAYIQDYWDDLQANRPSQADHDQFEADYAAFLGERATFLTGYDAFMADYNAFLADYNAFLAEKAKVWTDTGKQLDDAKAFFAKVAKFQFEYAGVLGTVDFNTLKELLKWVLNKLWGILDPDDPNNAPANNGQLILDWNGQCIHAYNNVASDLRVNQNNPRTGYATGGVIEDNRFFTIGQIRHYDGIFRQNEVGSRAIPMSLLDPSIKPSALSQRTIANDGANQGWYMDNVIYGTMDMTFHGHHHSNGFFSPVSHYHGSNTAIVEMVNPDGSCKATDASIDPSHASGPAHDYPEDRGIDILGTPVTTTPPDTDCLDHFDHGKRWTSVLFTHNVLIDPNGAGARFNDRAHRANDEQANSEAVRELKAPHFHQKYVELDNNTIVGRITVDTVNAAGTLLWSDDWSAVKSPTGAARTLEALAHPGAEIVTSHPYRNDAYVDIRGNQVFATQGTGIVLNDGDMLTLLNAQRNQVYGLNKDFRSGLNLTSFVTWLKAQEKRLPDDVYKDMAAWGGTDRGVQVGTTLTSLRNGFRVEHCGNVARGIDVGLRAVSGIYDDGKSIVHACGENDWGSASLGVDLLYTPAPKGAQHCMDNARQLTADTDDFYATELAYDTVDPSVAASTCRMLPIPSSPPGVPSQPTPAPAGPRVPVDPNVVTLSMGSTPVAPAKPSLP